MFNCSNVHCRNKRVIIALHIMNNRSVTTLESSCALELRLRVFEKTAAVSNM